MLKEHIVRKNLGALGAILLHYEAKTLLLNALDSFIIIIVFKAVIYLRQIPHLELMLQSQYLITKLMLLLIPCKCSTIELFDFIFVNLCRRK